MKKNIFTQKVQLRRILFTRVNPQLNVANEVVENEGVIKLCHELFVFDKTLHLRVSNNSVNISVHNL